MSIADELASLAESLEHVLGQSCEYEGDTRADAEVFRRAVEALRAADATRAMLNAVWSNLNLTACRKCGHLHTKGHVCYECGYDYTADERPSAAERGDEKDGEYAYMLDKLEEKDAEIARLTAENKALREACSPEPAYNEPGEYASDGEVYCRECGEPYTVHDGCDPTPECDACAHVVLARLRALAAGGGDR